MSRVISKEEYDAFRTFLEEASGILLGETKHYLVSSRLSRLMEEYQMETFSDLMRALRDNSRPGIRDKVVNAMTTNETMWFRDIYPFELLRTQLLSEFSHIKDRPLRIWSSACSTGQEPYSLSMIVQEYLYANPGSFPGGVQIVATDISSPILEYAKTGSYDETEVNRGMSEERRNMFFNKVGDRWEVKQEIRSRVMFRLMSLQQNFSSMSNFDLIFCRNVLIYFSAELKTDILERMADILTPQGYLVLGGSEAPNRYTDRYAMVRLPQGVIYKHS